MQDLRSKVFFVFALIVGFGVVWMRFPHVGRDWESLLIETQTESPSLSRLYGPVAHNWNSLRRYHLHSERDGL
jgi:hypothetical protein